MKRILEIVGLLAAVMGLVGCATYQLESPTVVTPMEADGTKIYVGPYKVNADLGTQTGKWDRDVYIKEAIAKKMKATFVDNPNDATVHIYTNSFKLSYVLYDAESNTALNDMTFSSRVYIPNFTGGFWRDKDFFVITASADADLIAECILRYLSGQRFSKANAWLTSKGAAYTGIENLEFKP